MTNDRTHTLDDWIVDSGCTSNMTYDESITTYLTNSTENASNLEASCMGNVFLGSSSS